MCVVTKVCLGSALTPTITNEMSTDGTEKKGNGFFTVHKRLHRILPGYILDSILRQNHFFPIKATGLTDI